MSIYIGTNCNFETSLSRTATSLEDIQELFHEYEIESQRDTHDSQETSSSENQSPFGDYSYYWFK